MLSAEVMQRYHVIDINLKIKRMENSCVKCVFIEGRSTKGVSGIHSRRRRHNHQRRVEIVGRDNLWNSGGIKNNLERMFFIDIVAVIIIVAVVLATVPEELVE